MKPTKNQTLIIALIFIGVLFSGCQPVLPVLALRPMDFIMIPIYYVALSFVFGGLQSVLISERTTKQYVVRNLCFTPLYGFVSVVRELLKAL